MMRYKQRPESEAPVVVSFRATPAQVRKIEVLARATRGNKSAALAALVDAAIVDVVTPENNAPA